ncbi:ATP-binding cassette domain-containing protein [Paenibacillus sp. SYP-B3998]|uniref:energy-coupling factor ABC transporter ATP-binding protein n=1 Tax=Paenibacillus sp. SYP-B3998 TaxID=2678564 RepID=UPI001F07C0F1|nr:ATP-binding cassette domain-containing protein [Paenibacillus sp. SYP-B3998]
MSILRRVREDKASMIEMDNFSFAYPGNHSTQAKGISLEIKESETVLLLGPSGSGKSTLALCLCGLIPHVVAGKMSGVVRINGWDTQLTEPGELASCVGTVFQDPDAQTIMMTVEEEIAFGLENVGVSQSEMEDRITEALRTVGLSVQGNTPVDWLSGGQKQRLALSSILAMEPKVLVLDEPTANLDPAGTTEVFNALRRLKSSGDYTIVLIEHKLDELVDLVDRVIVMDKNGEKVCSGTPETIFYDWAVELERLGVWFPQAVELTHKLQAAGFPIESRVLSMKQLADELRNSAPTLHADDEGILCLPIASTASICEGSKAASDSLPLLDIRPVGSPACKEGWLKPLKLQVR